MNPEDKIAGALLAAVRRGRRPAGAPLVKDAADVPDSLLKEIRAAAVEEVRRPVRAALLLKRAFAAQR